VALADREDADAGRQDAVALDVKRWKSLGFDTLVVDELSAFKHTSTNRFKAIKLILGPSSAAGG